MSQYSCLKSSSWNLPKSNKELNRKCTLLPWDLKISGLPRGGQTSVKVTEMGNAWQVPSQLQWKVWFSETDRLALATNQWWCSQNDGDRCAEQLPWAQVGWSEDPPPKKAIWRGRSLILRQGEGRDSRINIARFHQVFLSHIPRSLKNPTLVGTEPRQPTTNKQTLLY